MITSTEDELRRELSTCLIRLYGIDKAAKTFAAVTRALPSASPVRQELPAVILSAYPAGLVSDAGESGLAVLAGFFEQELAGLVSDVHILPPYFHSGDFGFAVDNHRMIDSEVGDWSDLRRIGLSARLMLDFVVNHVGVGAPSFIAAQRGDEGAEAFFIRDQGFDTSRVARGNSPFRSYHLAEGSVDLWSTFTERQLDLNYRNPDVFVEMAAQLGFVIAAGAEGIRLDALVFAWKESGTSCVGLPEVTLLAQAFRCVARLVRPGVVFLGEADLSGPGSEMVRSGSLDLAYRYELPPLVAHALVSGDPEFLAEWLAEVEKTGSHAAGLIALGTHDGLFLRPYDPPLPHQVMTDFVAIARSRGAFVEEIKLNGEDRPYELDISFPDLLAGGSSHLVAAISLLLSLPGTPLLSLRNVLGVGGNYALVKETGVRRAVNRGPVRKKDIDYSVLDAVRKVLSVRRNLGTVFTEGVHEVRTCASALSFVRGEPGVKVLANLSAFQTRVSTTSVDPELDPWEIRWVEQNSGTILLRSTQDAVDFLRA